MRTVMALSLISTGSPFWRMLISYTDSRPSSASFSSGFSSSRLLSRFLSVPASDLLAQPVHPPQKRSLAASPAAYTGKAAAQQRRQFPFCLHLVSPPCQTKLTVAPFSGFVQVALAPISQKLCGAPAPIHIF